MQAIGSVAVSKARTWKAKARFFATSVIEFHLSLALQIDVFLLFIDIVFFEIIIFIIYIIKSHIVDLVLKYYLPHSPASLDLFRVVQ